MLPGVTDVLVWEAPWISPEPPAVDPAAVRDLTGQLRRRQVAEAVIFTSFHQSPLPMALLLRMAGVARISAISPDYPGSLLDVRHRPGGDMPEVQRALDLAQAAGFELPPGDDGRLRVTMPLPDVTELTGPGPYIVMHPGASVPARAPSPGRCAAMVAALAGQGCRVVVTGGPAEQALTAQVAGGSARDLGGRTSLRELAAVLAAADVAVIPNTGAAHLAAAVGTAVVSLFAPVVPAARWQPYGVPVILLGNQQAPCAGSRARRCPIAGHPCLDRIDPAEVTAAVAKLSRPQPALAAGPPTGE
jgi:ADP-heptose:LPS heptosyltransferase